MKTAGHQTSSFPQDLCGEHIAKALQEVLKSWNLNPIRLVAVTMDNGTKNVKALQLTECQRMQDALFTAFIWSLVSTVILNKIIEIRNYLFIYYNHKC